MDIEDIRAAVDYINKETDTRRISYRSPYKGRYLNKWDKATKGYRRPTLQSPGVVDWDVQGYDDVRIAGNQ